MLAGIVGCFGGGTELSIFLRSTGGASGGKFGAEITGGAILASSCVDVAGGLPTASGCTFTTGGLFTAVAARGGSIVTWLRASTIFTGGLGVLRIVFAEGRPMARSCRSGFFTWG